MSDLVHAFFESFGVFGQLEGIDEILYVAIHKVRQVIIRDAYSMVRHTALWVVVGSDFC